MSETTHAAAASVPAALSPELKTAVLAAADAQLAAVTADVARLKGAVSGDLAGIGAAGRSEFDRLESRIIAEVGSLRAELSGAPLRYFAIAAVLAVASAATVLGHFVAHLF